MAKKDKSGNKEQKDPKEKKEANKILTILIVLLIVLIWFAFFGFLIKLDIGGFGSGVLSPILKDVPIVNQILPNDTITRVADKGTNTGGYKSLEEAVAKIKELEKTIDSMNTDKTDSAQSVADLQAEIKRLKVFEENQKAFEAKVAEFNKNVVFADAAPNIEEYKKYYEQIDPTNAAALYQQVVEQLQYSDAIQKKADIYKNMDPAAAAKVFETMSADIENVSKILLCMKPKESAAIIAEMDPVVAAKITKKMLDMDAEKLAN